MSDSEPAIAFSGEEARKLLDNGWCLLVWKDGLDQYSALAVPKGTPVDEAMAEWVEHEVPEDVPIRDWAMHGPNRYCGCGFSVAEALHSVTEKALFRRLPGMAGS